MRVIRVEEADRQISKEVVLDITKEEFESLKLSLQEWRYWRKVNMDSVEKSGTHHRFIGPVLSKRDNEYILCVNRWIGNLSGGGVVIELCPKFPVKAALNIVCTNALRNMGHVSAPPNLKETAQIPEEEMGFAVAFLLVSFVEQIIKLGLRANYVTKNQCSIQPRGRILISQQMSKQKGLLFPVCCQVQVHTYDSPENQFIKAALKRISLMIKNQSMRSYDETLLQILNRKINEYLYQFEQFGVTNRPFHCGNIPTLHFHKLNYYYQPACSISSIILSNSSCGSLSEFQSERGEISGSCWLYNMANEFEQFVRDSLKRSERLSTLSKGHVDWSMMANQVHMEPDLVLDNRTLIGDVKYRKYSHSKRRPDIFQVLAYSNTKIAVLQDVVLVYASIDSLFLKQVKHPQFNYQNFLLCTELDEHILLQDLRENCFLACQECLFGIDLLCSWDFEKRIWCCCMNLPESTHSQLIQQIQHITKLLEKHLP